MANSRQLVLILCPCASRFASSFPRATQIALVSVNRRFPIQIESFLLVIESFFIGFFKKLAHAIHIIALKYLTTLVTTYR